MPDLQVSKLVKRKFIQRITLKLTFNVLEHPNIEVKRFCEPGTALDEKPILELRSASCRMRSHGVTCHPTQVNVPRLKPKQLDRSVLDLHIPEE